MNLDEIKFSNKDFFRFYQKDNGAVVVNKIKMLTLVFVKHITYDENGEELLSDKTYTFVNPFQNRIPPKTKVRVQTRVGESDAVVVSSIKIPQKYVGALFYGINGYSIKNSPLMPVIGIYNEKYTPLGEEGTEE